MMTCTRCGGPLLADLTCRHCLHDVYAAPATPRGRPDRFKIVVAVGCAVAVLGLTTLGLAAWIGLVRQGHTSAVKAVDAHIAPQPTRSATADPAAPPAKGLAVSGKTLTAAAARDLARKWFQQRDPARVVNDDRTLKGLETADAYRVDQGFTQQILCGCENPKHLHQLQSVRVVLPKAPVRAFVAQFDTRTIEQRIPASYTVVFVASSGTWRAAIVALNEADAGTFHPRPGQPSNSKNHDYARRLLNQFGAYAYSARTTGHVPTSLGAAWTGYAPTLANRYAIRGQDRANSHGIYEHYSVPVVTSGYAFPVLEGELVCGAIADTAALAPGVGQWLLQDPARHNWGSTLPPGNYDGLTQYFDNEVCMIVHPNGTRDVISFYGTQTDLKPARRPQA